MTKKAKIIFIVFCVLISTKLLAAGKEYSYREAYSICSPVADRLAKNECNFARIYESYYENCMYEQGIDENDENFDSGSYQQYLRAYGYCSSNSDGLAKSYCGYGKSFKTHYDRCMERHGYDGEGNKLTESPSTTREPYFHFDF